ncbi:MAG TPA: hypothetical protein VKS82_23425 [Streptosporangiaceae bacterium]|jgi:hypothetical protein|nr:hypothetical protein [Streptosporangiaceae bacterium]
MLGTPARSFLSLVAAALALAAASPAGATVRPARDPIPIGHDQYFKGLVDNHPPGQAIIFMSLTSCTPGATTGHPLGGQPVEVQTTSPVSTQDVGYTGTDGDSIGATAGPVSPANVILKFTSYFVPQDLPTTITLPCSGNGEMDFIPAPHSSNAITAVLPVTFEVQP